MSQEHTHTYTHGRVPCMQNKRKQINRNWKNANILIRIFSIMPVPLASFSFLCFFFRSNGNERMKGCHHKWKIHHNSCIFVRYGRSMHHVYGYMRLLCHVPHMIFFLSFCARVYSMCLTHSTASNVSYWWAVNDKRRRIFIPLYLLHIVTSFIHPQVKHAEKYRAEHDKMPKTKANQTFFACLSPLTLCERMREREWASARLWMTTTDFNPH